MKEIKFTEEEKGLLYLVIENELDYIEKSSIYFDKSKRLINRQKQLNSITGQLKERDGLLFLSESEIKLLEGCIKKYRQSLVFCLPLKENFKNWIILSDDEINIQNKIDTYSDILMRIRPVKEKNSSFYRDKIFTINKMKNSDVIFLSKTRQSDYYKIGFVFQKIECFVFELKSIVSFSHIIHKQNIDIEETSKEFSLKTDKKQALKIFSEYENQDIPSETLEIVKLLLE